MKIQVVVSHQVTKAIAPFVAHPAFVGLALGVYGKRDLLVMMKRACSPVNTAISVSVKSDVLANQSHNVCA